MFIKIHRGYRNAVAVCDSGLIGKVFEEGVKQLDMTGVFFGGDEKDSEEIKKDVELMQEEDATFNFVGKDSVALAKELGMVVDEGVIKIQGVPVALVLL